MSKIYESELDARQWMTAQEAALRLGVCHSHAIYLLRKAKIWALFPAGAKGGRGYYWRAAVVGLVRERRAARLAPPGYISAKEAAAEFGVREFCIRYLANKWQLPYRVLSHGKGRGKKVYPRKLVEGQLIAARSRKLTEER